VAESNQKEALINMACE